MRTTRLRLLQGRHPKPLTDSLGQTEDPYDEFDDGDWPAWAVEEYKKRKESAKLAISDDERTLRITDPKKWQRMLRKRGKREADPTEKKKKRLQALLSNTEKSANEQEKKE